MADGSQHDFGFRRPGESRLRQGEIIVDLFAGGGGGSEALRQALGRDPDIAINHDAVAIGMHAVNHPYTRHLREDIYHADPRREVGGRPVGWLHASPDCTHHSQAKGGQPRDHARRSLSWVVLKWIGSLDRLGLAPRIVSLENVREILNWCRLVAKRDKATGRVIKLDEKGKVCGVAAPGERVPRQRQFLVPDRKHLGTTWRQFVAAIAAFGYQVEWRMVRACDFGAGTTRKRMFMVARRDATPVWPKPTHGPGLLPYVTAADCINLNLVCPSIFERKKPHAKATCLRIARGVWRYVIDCPTPFIVPNNTNNVPKPISEPVPTITTGPRNLLVVPTLVQCANASASGIASATQPLGVITAQPKGGSHALVVATLAQLAHGEGSGATKRRGSGAHDIREPVGTVHAGGNGFALVTAHLEPSRSPKTVPSPMDKGRPLGSTVTAYIVKFYQQGGQWQGLHEPMHTVTTKARMGFVEVVNVPADILTPELLVKARRCAAFMQEHLPEKFAIPADIILVGERVMVDIGLRMLQPSELFAAQGFPSTYIFDRTASGRRISKEEAVRMVGNSVSPPPLRAIAEANLAYEPSRKALAA